MGIARVRREGGRDRERASVPTGGHGANNTDQIAVRCSTDSTEKQLSTVSRPLIAGAVRAPYALHRAD